MNSLRTVYTKNGPLTYILIHKQVKNLNLRVHRTGEVTLSVPMRCSAGAADDWIRMKSDWIIARLAQQKKAFEPELLPELDRAACYRVLEQAVERVYPLAESLGVARPVLKIRKMRSQWGNCHWSQGYITLNVALHRCPAHLQDYVALHELIHFLHHDHGPGFYAVLDVLMSDWRARRKELMRYSSAIPD